MRSLKIFRSLSRECPLKGKMLSKAMLLRPLARLGSVKETGCVLWRNTIHPSRSVRFALVRHMRGSQWQMKI